MGVSKSRVLHRSLRETPPKAIGGEGVWLIGEDGQRILDASGGAAVSCLGHQHPRVLEAMSRQASIMTMLTLQSRPLSICRRMNSRRTVSKSRSRSLSSLASMGRR